MASISGLFNQLDQPRDLHQGHRGEVFAHALAVALSNLGRALDIGLFVGHVGRQPAGTSAFAAARTTATTLSRAFKN